MSKLSFRARALDAAKALPVYRSRDLPDLNDCVSINRAVPQMPTGMEKEEELEHHLQRAITGQQVFMEKKENLIIPVPEAESNVAYYDRLYKGEVKIPKQLIHIEPFGLDNEHPDFDMDSEDETLLNRLNRKMEIKPLQFEIMIDRLEKASTNQLVSFPEAKLLLNEDDYLLKSVYDYWVRKRKNCRGPSLIPQVRQEKRDGSTNNDPYVAFRRRTEKMQTRKNRKNDEASYEKMLKLRREFSRAVTILEMIKRREKSKRELLHLTLEVVEKRYQLGDFDGEILKEVTGPRAEKSIYSTPLSILNANNHKVESKLKCQHSIPVKDDLHYEYVRPKKKYIKKIKLDTFRPSRPDHQSSFKCDIKQYDFHSSGDEDFPQIETSESEPEEENNPDGIFVFRRKEGCQYLAPLEEPSDSLPWEHTELAGLQEPHHRHRLTVLSTPHRCVGLARRRMGRGGRLLLDRTSSDHDSSLQQLDPDMLSSIPVRGLPDVSVSSDASRTFPGRAGTLAEILSDIQTCRWRCYRPRPAPRRTSEDESLEQKAELLNTTAFRQDRPGCITEEQFHTHQQQVVQMQKQQLAQQQQEKQPLQPSCQPLHHSHTQTPNLGKTLDSASAQFAASAVISAPCPAVGEVEKERKSHTIGVNGVHTSGTLKPVHSTSTALVAAPVQLLRTSPGQLPPTLCTTTHQSLPGAGSAHLGGVTVVSPISPHPGTRVSAPSPSPSALKLATVAASLDRVPKVSPASAIGSIGRENNEPERLLNGLSETTVAMEVT